jgi:hypothetical protein
MQQLWPSSKWFLSFVFSISLLLQGCAQTSDFNGSRVLAAEDEAEVAEGTDDAANDLGLRIRKVKKRGDVEVPEGMHIVMNNAGERYLVPLSMDAVPERVVETKYYKLPRGAAAPREIDRIGRHVVMSAALPAEEVFVEESLLERIPRSFANLVRLEKFHNEHARTSPDLLALGDFSPTSERTFKLPYIPIPASEMQFDYMADWATDETKKLVHFKKDGVDYVRHFIHPNYPKTYEDLIKKYGIVYHYEAVTTASPRSLIVIDPVDPSKVHWIKPSLHAKIDGSVRINIDTKLRRGPLISEAVANVPDSVMRDFNLSFMLEPASTQPPGKISGTIFREVSPELLRPKAGHSWMPAFTLTSKGRSGDPVLTELIRKSRQQPKTFVKEKIVRPLLAAYLNMGLLEGLPGELHTQNYYIELGRNGLPTGRLLFKDNDGFRFDTEIALRRGRNLEYFAKFDKPFYWGKYSNALGEGAERIPFLGSWYYKLIRNVAGFETLSSYILEVMEEHDPRGGWDKPGIQKLFDDIAAEEAERITGIRLEADDYGFGRDKHLNKVLNEYRARLSREMPTADELDVELQAKLRREWSRLQEEGRVSAMRRSVGPKTVFVAHKTTDDTIIIEARNPVREGDELADPTAGFAILETKEDPKGQAFRRAFAPRFRARGCAETVADLVKGIM